MPNVEGSKDPLLDLLIESLPSYNSSESSNDLLFQNLCDMKLNEEEETEVSSLMTYPSAIAGSLPSQAAGTFMLTSSAPPENQLMNYLCFTRLNSKLQAYFENVYIPKISVIPVVRQSWSCLFWKSFHYPPVMHISMALSLGSLFYDAELLAYNGKKEPVLGLNDPLNYKEMAELHYQEFLRCSRTSNGCQSKNFANIFTYISTATLHVLYHVTSICGSFCDPHFFKLARTGSSMYKESIQVVEFEQTNENYYQNDLFFECAQLPDNLVVNSEKDGVAEYLDMSYYCSHSTPVVAQSIWLFFPSYLYQIIEQQTFESDETYQNLQINFEILKRSIDMLRREYNLVYNNYKPESDSLRVLLRWPSLISEDLFEPLRLQDPRLLIVIAHFIVLLRSLDFDQLIPKSKLQHQVANIGTILDHNWSPWLDLPKRCVGLL